MSGPKIDAAELARREKERLERERRIRLENIKRAMARYRKITDDIQNSINEIHSVSQYYTKESAEYMEIRQHRQQVETSEKTSAQGLMRLIRTEIPSEPEDIEKWCDQLLMEKEKLVRQYNIGTENARNRMDQFFESIHRQEKLSEISSQMTDSIMKNQSVNFVFVQQTVQNNTTITDDLKENTEKAISSIRTIIQSDALKRNDRRLINDFIQILMNPDLSENELRNTLREFSIAFHEIEKHVNDFEDLYAEYDAEYVVYLEKLNEFRKSRIPILPKSRNQFHSYEDLENEIKQLQNSVRQVDERNYIKDCIEKVMKQFGYNLCEDIVLSEDQTTDHFICESNSKAAVHVSISDTKQVMMEIVGTGTRKSEEKTNVNAVRLDKDELDEKTVGELLDAQGQFCEIHPEITKELEKYGIRLNELKHCKPSTEYCRAIAKIVSTMNTDSQTETDAETDKLINHSYVRSSHSPGRKERTMK